MAIKFDLRHKPLDGDLLITMACPVGCNFCVYSCLPSMEPQKWMPEETIRRVAEEYSKNDIAIRICGGEPFFNLEKLKNCIDILLEYYNPFDLNIITSAIFAGTKENAIRNLKVIKDSNFDRVIVSVDRFHLPRVPFQKIINMIEAARELDIEIILRLSLDTESLDIMDKMAKIIVRYQTPIEVHSWGIVGRAENLDTTVLNNFDVVEEYVFKKIAYYAERYNCPKDSRFYLTYSAKKSQLKFMPDFFPTTFPNGNTYASSFTFKSELMGNINNENLSDMIHRFKRTLSGHFIFSDYGHRGMRKLIPEKFEDQFDISRNEPFTESIPEEAIGRKFIKIYSNDNFDDIFKKLKEERRFHGFYGVEEREFLLSFRLTEEDLWNERTSLKIQNFLNKLKNDKIKFVLSRPIPPCLKIKMNNSQPKSCSDCRELFTVKNGKIVFCDCIKNKEGPDFKYIKNREQIIELFKIEKKKMMLSKMCNNCLFYIRKQCYGFTM